MTPLRWEGGKLVVLVRVQPRAARERVVGVHGGELKVALTAPPVEGAANAALGALLARELGVAKGDVNLVQGGNSRSKRLVVEGVSREAAEGFCQRHALPLPAPPADSP